MGKDVKLQTNLVRRGRVYQFRARIPEDLQECFDGKKELSYSLRTTDKAEAVDKVRIERLKFDQECAHKRAVRDASLVDELPAAELERLASLYYAKLLGEDEEIRAGGLLTLPVPGPVDMFTLYGRASEGFTKKDGERLARGDVKLPDPDMDAFLERHGIKLAPSSEGYRRAAYAFTRERKRAGDAVMARHRGDPVDTPPVAADTVLRSPAVLHREDTLDALLAYWQTQKTRPANTVRETRHAAKLLRKITGAALPASRVEKRHIVQLKDELRAEGKAASTVGKLVNLLRAVFQVAVDNGKLPQNPAAGVKVPRNEFAEAARVPFSRESLHALFHSEVYTHGKRPQGGAGEAAYWLPLLGLWTGARLDELGQLEVGDIKEEEEGVWYLDFVPNPAKGKRLKNANSRRRVPLHPELIRCGFLAYVEQTKAAGHSWLFPRLSSAPNRKRTASFSQWFGRYLRQVVRVSDHGEVFHSFRHGFMTVGRAAGLRKEMLHQFTGHGTRDEGDGYGGWTMPTLAEGMGRIRYAGLDLSHLYKQPEAASKGE